MTFMLSFYRTEQVIHETTRKAVISLFPQPWHFRKLLVSTDLSTSDKASCQEHNNHQREAERCHMTSM